MGQLRIGGWNSTLSLAVLLCVLTATGCAGPRIDARSEDVLEPMSDTLMAAEQLTVRSYRTVNADAAAKAGIPASAELTVMVGTGDRFATDVMGEGLQRKTFYDGETFTMFDVRGKTYGSVPAPDGVAELIEMVKEEYGFSQPLLDLLIDDPACYLTEEAKSVTYAGHEYVSRFECHHLVISKRDATVDLWVSVADGLPVRLAMTKEGAEELCYAIDVAEIDLDAEHADDVFEFVPPEGAKEVEGLPVGQ